MKFVTKMKVRKIGLGSECDVTSIVTHMSHMTRSQSQVTDHIIEGCKR